MAKVRQVLGHVSVEIALRRRVCHRNRSKHSIPKGDACLVIRDPSTGNSKNYCAKCAEPILDRADEDLEDLREQLS